MSRVRIENDPRGGGICRACDHDLETRRSGSVFCTNPDCRFYMSPHPTGKSLNLPRAKK